MVKIKQPEDEIFHIGSMQGFFILFQILAFSQVKYILKKPKPKLLFTGPKSAL